MDGGLDHILHHCTSHRALIDSSSARGRTIHLENTTRSIGSDDPSHSAEIPRRLPRAPESAVPPFLTAVLGLLAIGTLVLHNGFALETRVTFWLNILEGALAVGFVFSLIAEIFTASRQTDTLRRRRFEMGILALFLFSLAICATLPSTALAALGDLTHQETRTDLLLGTVRIFLLANVSVQLLRLLQRIFALGVRTEIILAGSFAALILVGTLLLQLPRVSAKPEAPISLIDSFFTATSAVCVTGLGVRDTGTDFSTLGQLIIMGLFQVGGLGIVTFIAFLSAFSEKSLPVPQMVAFRGMINAPAMGDIKRRLAGIILLTAIIEITGAICLFVSTPGLEDPFDRLKWSVFHSISAFCNAGFALQADGLESFAGNPAVVTTIMMLIVLGGLGFLVLPELLAVLAARMRQLPYALTPLRRKFVSVPSCARLSVQSRISLVVTGFLLLAGLVGFWALEAGHLLSGKSAAAAFSDSFFQSVTSRTAGFNTVPIGSLQQSTLILIIALMIIGGCPVSTAGGIKTVTFGILVLALRSLIFQKQRIEAFGRTVAPRALFTALNVFVLYMMTAAVCLFLLTITDPGLALRDTVFETFSALSTVGLSTGITPQLSTGGKLTLCLAMFIGRVGPIALVLTVFQSRDRVKYEFPTEDVVVG